MKFISILFIAAFLAAPLDAQTSPILGKKLPELSLSHAVQGDAWSGQSLEGKVVILDVFQIGCPKCMSNSLPHAQKLYEQYSGDGRVAVVAIATAFEKDEYPWMADEKQIMARLKTEGWTFPVMRDKDEKSVRILGFNGIHGTPTTAVIAPDGTVAWHKFNGTDESAAEVEETLERLLESFYVPAIADLDSKLSAYAKGNFDRAYKNATRIVERAADENDDTDPALLAQAKLVVANIDGAITRMVETAKSKRAAGYPEVAEETLEEAAKVFRGVNDAPKDLLREWKKDADFRKELGWADKLAKIEASMAERPDSDMLAKKLARLAEDAAGSPVAGRIEALRAANG